MMEWYPEETQQLSDLVCKHKYGQNLAVLKTQKFLRPSDAKLDHVFMCYVPAIRQQCSHLKYGTDTRTKGAFFTALDVPMLLVVYIRISNIKAITIGNYVSGPLPASFLGKREISEIHGENSQIKILKQQDFSKHAKPNCIGVCISILLMENWEYRLIYSNRTVSNFQKYSN